MDLGEPIYRTNYSHYNEATKNGNDRDYTTVARTDANWIFGGNEQRIIGIGIDRRSGKDGIRIVYETPYVDMQETTPLTQEEKDEFMQNYGFEKVESETLHKDKGESSKYTNGNFTIGDLHSMNIVRDSEGNVRCTDPIIRWEQGERYRLQTEEEVEHDEANEKKMDALFDDEEIEAQIESVYQNHF